MMTRLNFLLFVFLTSSQVYGQYKPMAVEGARWVVFALSDNGPAHHAMVVRGDTLIGDTPYKKVFRRDIVSGATILSEFSAPYHYSQETLIGGIRDNAAEEAVYGLAFEPNAWYFDNCNILEEQLMHDFSMSVGDEVTSCLHSATGSSNVVVDSIGEELLFGMAREVQYTGWGPLIESIGTWLGPFVPIYWIPVPGNPSQLVDYCVGTDDECGFLLTATHELPFEAIAEVYPNPASNQLFIAFKPAFPGNALATIYGNDGTRYAVGPIVPPTLELDIHYLPAGTYALVMESKKWKSTTKFIVAR